MTFSLFCHWEWHSLYTQFLTCEVDCLTLNKQMSKFIRMGGGREKGGKKNFATKKQNILKGYSWIFEPLNMIPLGYLITSRTNYPLTHCHIPDKRIPQLHYCKSVKTCSILCRIFLSKIISSPVLNTSLF